ncbi:uncharacterized protein LOC129586786 [Paramacrobiotus metropolitanus]|uniref:uncharacterized protein LOC129586786 n=1 Tax=Paramacrobiotus metropolitanus TaxID=2943436 RepID=UPI0024458E8A|nr:uncharacterized protein LOC129586786 [Paramacrobiotus metropolitanus]
MSIQEKIINQNPVSFLYEFTTKNKYPAPVFTDEGACGEFRNFQCTVRLEKPPIVACGSARTKVLAKREAARKAVEQICPSFSGESEPQPAIGNGNSAVLGKRKEQEEQQEFPRLNTINPQETIVNLLRDVKWPDRTFSDPMSTLDGTFKIIVRAGPPEDMNKFCGKGVAMNIMEAKKSACCDLYQALERDYHFLALWYSIKSPSHPVNKKLKAKVAEMISTSDIGLKGDVNEDSAAQTPFEDLKLRIVAILRKMKQAKSPNENADVAVMDFMPLSDLLEKVAAQLIELDLKVHFSRADEKTLNGVSDEDSCEAVELQLHWKETGSGAQRGYPRELSFDGTGQTWKEAANNAADRCFGFLDVSEEDTQVVQG